MLSKGCLLCICFYFCPHFIHVMLNKGCLLSLFSLLSPCYTCHVKQRQFTVFVFTFVLMLFLSSFYTCDVKQGLLTLFVFTFVPMLHMSCQAKTVYCLCFHICPHVIGLHVAPSTVYSLFVDIKIKKSLAFLIIFVFVVSWHVSLDWAYLCGCKCMLCTVCLADCICVCKPTVGYFTQDRLYLCV